MWDEYGTSMGYGLSLCPKQETIADVGSFLGDLKITTHGVDEGYVRIREELRANLIRDLARARAKD